MAVGAAKVPSDAWPFIDCQYDVPEVSIRMKTEAFLSENNRLAQPVRVPCLDRW